MNDPFSLVSDSSLYFTDWGKHASVRKMKFSAVEDEEVASGFDNPNGVYIAEDGANMYVVDSHYKTRKREDSQYPIEPRNGTVQHLYRRTDMGGWLRNSSWNIMDFLVRKLIMESVLRFNNSHDLWLEFISISPQMPYGISGNGSNKLYVSDWGYNAIFSCTLQQHKCSSLVEGISHPMSVLYFDVPDEAASRCCSVRLWDLPCSIRHSLFWSCVAKLSPCNKCGGEEVCLLKLANGFDPYPSCTCNSYRPEFWINSRCQSELKHNVSSTCLCCKLFLHQNENKEFLEF